MTESRPGHHAWNRWDAFALLFVLTLGLVNLPQPFAWDQALFAINARVLNDGGALYRDVWDVKQPGIYLFYWLGGRAFGFSEAGIHALELLWNLGLALAILTMLRRSFRVSWGPAVAAVLAVGYACALMRDGDITQVESLVGLPLFICAAASLPEAAGPPRFGGAVVSGIAGSVALLFKLVFAPIVVSFWLLALIEAVRLESTGRARRLVRLTTAFGLGAMIPIATTIAWLAASGVLGQAWHVWTDVSARYLAMAQQSGHHRLLRAGRWFTGGWWPVLVLAVLGIAPAIRRRGIGVRMVAWIIVASIVIFLQRWSYWQYQFLLFAVPIGVLAALGTEWLARSSREAGARVRRVALAAILVAAVFSAVAALAIRLVPLVQNGFALSDAGRARYMEAVSSDDLYAVLRRDTELLRRPSARRGPIYVLGNPMINWITDRVPAAPRHGAVLPSYMSPQDWEGVTARLVTHPPAYVVLQKKYFDGSSAPHPAAASFFAWLDGSCTIVRSEKTIVIYAPRDSSR
jgi:hypothetical protein